MIKRDLLINPCWSQKDLGQALPNSPHAVSVALPRWQDVIDYEEQKPSCLNKLEAVYPRFGLNPLVQEVAQEALKLHGSDQFSAWPYPNQATAKEASAHCSRYESHGETFIANVLGLHCLIADKTSTPSAKAFWQHTGLGASSRLAAIALGKEKPPFLKAAKEAKEVIRKRLAEIYCCKAQSIQLHPSGMAALTTAIQAITEIRPNKRTLQIGFPYVDVLKLPEVVFAGSDLLLSSQTSDLAKKLDQLQPAAVIVELPSNPMLQCIDLPTISKLARERGIPVIADDTIGSAINIDVLPYADIVFSSLTKSFAGRGDILAGSLLVNPNSSWAEVLTKKAEETLLTPLADPDAIELEKTSRDVVERTSKLNIACNLLKAKLEDHPEIKRVLHPEHCPNFSSLRRPGAGYGCLLSFELIGGLKKAKKVYDSLEVCKGPSLGTNFTLACPYVLLAHYKELKWAKACGVPSHLIRVSVGLEDHEDLWNRFKKALKA